MFDKYAVNIPLFLCFVGLLSFLSSIYGGNIDDTVKDDSTAAESGAENSDETELNKAVVSVEEPQWCSCGRHIVAANYYCVEAIYYDTSDSEADSDLEPSSPVVSSSKCQGVNEKESPNFKPQTYSELLNNPSPTPYRFGSGVFWKMTATDVSRIAASPAPVLDTKASPDPSSNRILELEASLASSEAKRSQLDNDIRKELATSEADREKAREYISKLEVELQQQDREKVREYISKLEVELQQQRAFTAGAYAELIKYEAGAEGQAQLVQHSSQQIKIAQEEKQQLSSQLEAAKYNSDQKEAELEQIRSALGTAKIQANNDVIARDNMKNELRSVREELERTNAKADENLARYNEALKELFGVRGELDSAKANASKWEDTYQDTQKLLSTAQIDLKTVIVERDRALRELKQQPEHDTPMEPECNEPQDTNMDPDCTDNRIDQITAAVALVNIELSKLQEKSETTKNKLKDSKREAKIKARRINELTEEKDKLVKDHKDEVSSLKHDIKRLERFANANPAPGQAPRVSSVMNYTNYSQKQLVTVVKKYVQDCENLKLECERNRSEGKREGYEEGVKAGMRELAEQLVPLYLATGTRMTRDFTPADFCIDQTVGPDAKVVMTAKQTEYAELIRTQKDLSRIMRESGLPAVQKIRGKGRAREETEEELFDLQKGCLFSKRLRCTDEVEHKIPNDPCDSTMSEEGKMLPNRGDSEGQLMEQ